MAEWSDNERSNGAWLGLAIVALYVAIVVAGIVGVVWWLS
jgi:hypothetical protein